MRDGAHRGLAVPRCAQAYQKAGCRDERGGVWAIQQDAHRLLPNPFII
jgi:hypothetical protein